MRERERVDPECVTRISSGYTVASGRNSCESPSSQTYMETCRRSRPFGRTCENNPDLVVNLGDHLSGPLQASATADALMSEPWLHIRGNHDRQLLDRPFENMGGSDRAAYEHLQDRHKRMAAEPSANNAGRTRNIAVSRLAL